VAGSVIGAGTVAFAHATGGAHALRVADLLSIEGAANESSANHVAAASGAHLTVVVQFVPELRGNCLRVALYGPDVLARALENVAGDGGDCCTAHARTLRLVQHAVNTFTRPVLELDAGGLGACPHISVLLFTRSV